MSSAALRESNLHTVSTDPALRFDANDMTVRTIEVDVVDQKETGTCWMQAGLVYLSSLLKRTEDGKAPRFSFAHLSVLDKLGKTGTYLQMLRAPLDERARWHLRHDAIVHDGGTWPMFAHLVKTYGLVPHEAMPPTYQSEHTTGINRYLNMYLKSVADDVRSGRVTDEDVLAHVREALLRAYGPLPSDVQLREREHGVDYSGPTSKLGTSVLPPDAFDCVVLAHAPDRQNGTYAAPYSNDPSNMQQAIFEVVDGDAFVEAAVAQLRVGVPVWFSAEVRYDFSDKRGIAHVGLYDVGRLLDLPIADLDEKAARMKNGNTAPVHAMVLTAVKLAADDATPLQWRIQNSWGRGQRDRGGFITASHDWFMQHAFQIVVQRRHAPKLPDPSKAELLPLWDIFATVA